MERDIGQSDTRIDRMQIVLFCIYLFLSVFETYLTRFVGSNTKFYLLFVLAVFAWKSHLKIKINSYWPWFLLWFIYKVLSLSWSNMSNTDFQSHVLSQIGMVLFVVFVTGRYQNKEFVGAILRASLWVSFLFGLLSIFFRGSFMDERFYARQVLTLFGQQNDPNNCAAFLLVGIVLGMYGATVEKKKILINILIIAVNTYALLLTSSRAGFLTLGVVVLFLVFLPQPGAHIHLKATLQKLALVAVVVLFVAFIVQKYLPQVNLDRLLILSGYEGGSGRDVRWDRAFELFCQRPIFGWGWSGYYTGTGAIHNTFLTSLCDIGIFGTLLLVVPILKIFVDAVKNRNMLAFLLLIAGIVPSFVLDAINKRFFWNAIVISIMLLMYQKENGVQIRIWNNESRSDHETI